MKSLQKMQENKSGRYKLKLARLKQQIREYIHVSNLESSRQQNIIKSFQENAALLDELEEVQVQTIIRKEERKFLLRKLCQYEPQTQAQVQAFARGMSASANAHAPENKKLKRRHIRETGN